MKRLLAAIATLALAAIWVGGVTGAAASSARGGSRVTPAARAAAGTPNPKTLPGAKTVTFKMVFEGNTRAVGKRTFTNTEFGLCKVNGSDTIYENTEFARGNGVTMEFVRYKQHGKTQYAVQRVGRNGDASFAVVYKLKRRALGHTTLASAFPPAPCQGLQPEDFSKNPDCSQTMKGSWNWGLRLKGTDFSIVAARGRGNTHFSNCGKSSYFGGFENLAWEWPAPPPFDFDALPLPKMFGHTHAFKVLLAEPNPATTSPPNFEGVTFYEEGGPGGVVVRFIRVPNAP
jgi:hypothetical protein